MFYKEFFSFLLFLLFTISKAAIPGTFFWRPRLGIDMAMPTTENALKAFAANKKNIQAGLVVLIDGYDIMTSILGLLRGAEFAADDDSMDPAASVYYTGIYRWTLRTLDLLPHWLKGNFHEALGVWSNRFKYMEAEVPEWAKKVLPWVPKKSWDTEHEDLVKFRKLSESAFTQFYRVPSKTFNGFNSFLPESLDDFLFSSISRDDFQMSMENESKIREREELLKQRLNAIKQPSQIDTPDPNPAARSLKLKRIK